MFVVVTVIFEPKNLVVLLLKVRSAAGELILVIDK
jgi:hypothetical protein